MHKSGTVKKFCQLKSQVELSNDAKLVENLLSTKNDKRMNTDAILLEEKQS